MNQNAAQSTPMKSFISLCLLISLLSSCGGKLYSYRKTVKVNDPITKNEVIHAPKIYMTIHEVKPSKLKMDKPVSNIEQIKVNTNTVYETSKPLLTDLEKQILAVSISSSVMAR